MSTLVGARQAGGEQVADDVVPDAEEEVAGEHHDRLGGEVGDRDCFCGDEPVPGRQGEVHRHLAQGGSREVLVLGGADPHDGGVDVFLSDRADRVAATRLGRVDRPRLDLPPAHPRDP